MSLTDFAVQPDTQLPLGNLALVSGLVQFWSLTGGWIFRHNYGQPYCHLCGIWYTDLCTLAVVNIFASALTFSLGCCARQQWSGKAAILLAVGIFASLVYSVAFAG